MTETVPCLLRVGDNVKKYKLFKLDKDKVTIGRSGDVTYAILSMMISRCHAVIERKDDGSWDITDKKSLNGIFVNGRQLTPFEAYTLQDGDMVQLGVPTEPDMPAEFIYKFYSSLKVRIEKKNNNKRLKTDCSIERDTVSAGESIGSDSEHERKRKKPGGDEGKLNLAASPSKNLRQQIDEAHREQAQREAEYQAKLAEMETLLKEKEEKQLEVQHQLEQERQEKENQAREVEELRLKEQAILQEMQDKQEELEKEKERLKQKMQEELEESLRAREQALKDQLIAQREALMEEKKQVEANLQSEMEKALEEKDKKLEDQLLEQKQKLDKVIEKKELEQKMLESQLTETKEESATAKLQALQARDDVLSNFVDLMETELQCAICNELFIKATSLNCSHAFCKLCINQWMKVKKECPNCRSPITSQMQALALDSYICRMVEQLNDDLKQRRKELLDSRKVEEDAFFNPVKTSSSTTSARARGGARSRGGRGSAATARGGINNMNTASTTIVAAPSHSTRGMVGTRAASRRGTASTRGGSAGSRGGGAASAAAPLPSSSRSLLSGTPILTAALSASSISAATAALTAALARGAATPTVSLTPAVRLVPHVGASSSIAASLVARSTASSAASASFFSTSSSSSNVVPSVIPTAASATSNVVPSVIPTNASATAETPTPVEIDLTEECEDTGQMVVPTKSKKGTIDLRDSNLNGF